MPRTKTIDDEIVLDATVELIGDIGPGALTLARIGEAVGLSPATLVQRFGSRRGLLLEVAARGVDVRPVFARARAENKSPLAAIRAALLKLAAAIPSPEALANHIAFLHLDLTDAEFYELALEQALSRRRAIEKLLVDAVEAGELVRCDTAGLAETLDVIYNGALITWAIYRKGTLHRWLGRQLDRTIDPYMLCA